MAWKLRDGKTEVDYRVAYQAACEKRERRLYEVNEDLDAQLRHVFHEFHEEIPGTEEGEGM